MNSVHMGSVRVETLHGRLYHDDYALDPTIVEDERRMALVFGVGDDWRFAPKVHAISRLFQSCPADGR